MEEDHGAADTLSAGRLPYVMPIGVFVFVRSKPSDLCKLRRVDRDRRVARTRRLAMPDTELPGRSASCNSCRFCFAVKDRRFPAFGGSNASSTSASYVLVMGPSYA
jgi:hypothetical protein